MPFSWVQGGHSFTYSGRPGRFPSPALPLRITSCLISACAEQLKDSGLFLGLRVFKEHLHWALFGTLGPKEVPIRENIKLTTNLPRKRKLDSVDLLSGG